MRNLSEIVQALPEQIFKTVDIDISEQIGEPAGTTVFSYREPTAAQLFQAGVDGDKLSVRYLDMNKSMGSMVATIAMSHVAPPAEAPGLLYAELAMKNGKLFMWLLNRFLAEFPELQNLEAQTKAAKKPSSVE